MLLILDNGKFGQWLFQMVCLSFVNIGTTFAVFKLAAKFPDGDDKLANKYIGLLSGVLNNFRNLLEILNDPADLLFFGSLIVDYTSSEYLCFGFINFSSICLTI